MIVEPRAHDHAEFYFDHAELEFTDLSAEDADRGNDENEEIEETTQMWEHHWSTEWEESSTQIRITGDFGVVGLPQLVESN